MSLEDLKSDVAVRLEDIKKSCNEVENYRKQLQENARKIKEDIHSVVDRQLAALRGRERQLVRQVEVVTAHQNCLIRSQQAKLLQKEGALAATWQLINKCSCTDMATLSKIKMDDSTCTKTIKPANLVSVELDENSLNSSISSFGTVRLPETITHHPSPVIPAKVEEYEDEEHDVLHKSLAGPDSPVHITVKIPRLNKQDWLITRPHSSLALSCRGQREGNVASWLSNLQISQDEEVDSFPSSTSLEILDSTPLSSKSSSIEIVPFYFDDINKEDCITVSSPCEIENIPSCLDEKSRWLSTSSIKSGFEPIRFNAANPMNESHSSSDAKIGRKRKISEIYTNDLSRYNPVLHHMSTILQSANSQWLLKSDARSSGGHRLAKRALYESPTDKWLSTSKFRNVTNQTPSITSNISMNAHSNVWLLRKLKTDNKQPFETITIPTNEKLNQELSEKLQHCRIEPDPASLNSKSTTSNLYDVSFESDIGNLVIDNKLKEDKFQDSLNSNKKQWLLKSGGIISKWENTSTVVKPLQSFIADVRGGLDPWLVKRL